MATISKNLPKLTASVSEKIVPSNAISVVKSKVDSNASTIKKDIENLSKEFRNVSDLTKKLVSKWGLAGTYNGKSLESQVVSIANRLDDRADRGIERAKSLIEAIDRSVNDMQKTLFMVCQSWDEYQAKFKKYEL